MKEKRVSVLVNSRQIAAAAGVFPMTVKRAVDAGKILPDACDLRGMPLFRATRLGELCTRFQRPEVVA